MFSKPRRADDAALVRWRGPAKLFLSHKATTRDMAVAARVKQALSCLEPGIDVFLSSDASDLGGADPFLQRIPAELDARREFALLFTDRDQEWDWCLWETGYARGHHGDMARITAFHPANLAAPKPISCQLQTVFSKAETDTSPYRCWLKRVLAESKGRKSFCRPLTVIDAAADAIAAAVDQVRLERYRLPTFQIATPPGMNGRVVAGDIPPETQVTVPDNVRATLYMSLETLNWTQFANIMQIGHFELGALTLAMQEVARGGHVTNWALPIYVARDSGQTPVAFRFVITQQVCRMNEGAIELFIAPIPIEPTFNLNSDKPADIAFHLLVVAKSFRFHVIGKYIPKFDAMGDTPDAELGDAERQVLSEFHTAVNRTLLMSAHHRLNEPADRVKKALTALLQRILPDIGTTLDTYSRQWHTAYATLEYVCGTATRDDVYTLVGELPPDTCRRFDDLTGRWAQDAHTATPEELSELRRLASALLAEDERKASLSAESRLVLTLLSGGFLRAHATSVFKTLRDMNREFRRLAAHAVAVEAGESFHRS